MKAGAIFYERREKNTTGAGAQMGAEGSNRQEGRKWVQDFPDSSVYKLKS